MKQIQKNKFKRGFHNVDINKNVASPCKVFEQNVTLELFEIFESIFLCNSLKVIFL